MSISRQALVLGLGVALGSVALEARAQAATPASGTWTIQEPPSRWSKSGVLTLELTQVGDSVMGQLTYSGVNAPADRGRPLWGAVEKDSLYLADANGAIVVAAQLSGNRMIGRMHGGWSRTVATQKSIQYGQRVRFLRQ